MKTSLVALAATSVLLIACAGPERDPAAEGAALLVPFKTNLKAELVDAMQKGPVEAIAVCNTAAPAIAESLSVEGVRMGRSSHKLRNPDNVAPEWLDMSDLPVVVALEDGRHGYAEAIVTQPLCLVCHGETLQPEVAARITELYPDDQATGFKEGDLRGVFWVEF